MSDIEQAATIQIHLQTTNVYQQTTRRGPPCWNHRDLQTSRNYDLASQGLISGSAELACFSVCTEFSVKQAAFRRRWVSMILKAKLRPGSLE